MPSANNPPSLGFEGGIKPKVCVIYAYPTLDAKHGSALLQKTKDLLQKEAIDYSMINLYGEKFNPVLSQEEYANYGKGVEPDVLRYQQILGQAEVWIIIYPVWWAVPPAILKGFFDRVLTPGFAFSYTDAGQTPLLSNKRALIIRTFGSSAAQESENGNVASLFMEKSVLGFCGIKSFSVDIYSIESLAMSAFNNFLMHIEGAVRRALVKPTGVPHHMRTIPAPYLPPIEEKEKDEPSESNDKEKKKELTKQAQEDLEFFRQERRFARKEVHRKADRQRDLNYTESFGEGNLGKQLRRNSEERYTGRQRREEYTGRQRGEYSGRQTNSSYGGRQGRSNTGEVFGRQASAGYGGRARQNTGEGFGRQNTSSFGGRGGREGQTSSGYGRQRQSGEGYGRQSSSGYGGRQPNRPNSRSSQGPQQGRHGKMHEKNQKRKRFFFR